MKFDKSEIPSRLKAIWEGLPKTSPLRERMLMSVVSEDDWGPNSLFVCEPGVGERVFEEVISSFEYIKIMREKPSGEIYEETLGNSADAIIFFSEDIPELSTLEEIGRRCESDTRRLMPRDVPVLVISECWDDPTENQFDTILESSIHKKFNFCSKVGYNGISSVPSFDQTLFPVELPQIDPFDEEREEIESEDEMSPVVVPDTDRAYRSTRYCLSKLGVPDIDSRLLKIFTLNQQFKTGEKMV